MVQTILAVSERSGLVEEYHPGTVAVADPSGRVVASTGDISRPFFVRSAAKPFQAQVATEAGLALPPTHLAVACSSHSGDPIHVAIVADLLRSHGLDESDLRCPPARPFPAADRRLAATGDVRSRPIFHNCSGKHAALLAACRAAGWETDSYLEPSHPLQERIRSCMEQVTDEEVGPPGVDGCGMPVWRVTAAGLARAFARLGADDRYRTVRTAMSRYPMLVSGEGRADGLLGRWTGGVAKGGAAGCMGVAYAGRGIGVKAWSGSGSVAGAGAALALDHVGVMTDALRRALTEVARPPVLGGGKDVGRIRPVALLE